MVKGAKMMYKDGVQVFVLPDRIDEYLSQGWTLGRLSPVWNKGLTKDDPRVATNMRNIRNLDDHTEQEKRRKISEKLKGRKFSEESLKKRSETVRGTKRSEEHKRKTSETLKGHPVSEQTRAKLSKANKGKSHPFPEHIKLKYSIERSSDEWQEKHNRLKAERGTFNTSLPEERAFCMLKTLFSQVERSYRDVNYKHNCDFYIPALKLFIELNYHWTHGGKPYNPNDEACQKQLEVWQEKAKTSKFYKQAINVWTVRDVRKLNDFISNNLNYKIFYTEKEFNIWFEEQTAQLMEKVS